MGDEPKGRGAALHKRLRDFQISAEQTREEAISSPSTSSSYSAGRGRSTSSLQHLRLQEEEKPSPVYRGRASLSQRLLQLNKSSELRLESTQREEKESEKVTIGDIPVVTEPEVSKPIIYRGTSGSECPATANYMRLSVDADKGVFEYCISFTPEIDNKTFRIKLINSQLDKFGGIKSFDGGQCLYLPIKLGSDPLNLNATHPSSGDNVMIQISYKKKKRLGDCVHLFNILFKRIMKKLSYYQFNRNYYDMKHTIAVPQHKLEVLPGYVTRVDEYEGGLLLCLDCHHKVLRTQTVLNLLVQLRDTQRERFKREAENMILGSHVLTRYNNRTYRIDDILWDASPDGTFETDGGKKITYVEYYNIQHGIKIHDIRQPLLLHRKSIKLPGVCEKEDRIICLIPELCYLTGLTDQMRNDFSVMKSIAEYTRLTPSSRMHALQKFVDNVNRNSDASKILSEWGLKLQEATIDLNIRVLNPEKIYFGGGSSHQSDYRTDWGGAASKFKVSGPVDLLNWKIVYVQKDELNAREFCELMMRLGSSMGCVIQRPQMNKLPNDRTATFVDACNNLISETLQCIVFITPSMRTDLYTSIKKICCLKSPVASQVILSRTLGNKKRFRNIVQKIALQINCKLGGTLWTVSIPVRTWMVCGIDVYHGTGKQSVCGFVGSLNHTFTRWYSVAFAQSKEISDHMKVGFASVLEKRKEIEGAFPSHVIIYRDGVGDGQLEHCLNYEVEQFRNCIKELNLDITLTFIVVQKRINTRVFLKKDNEKNPPPGSILDHTVTRYKYQDFFLISQHVTQGTVTPTHYIVLHDSGNIMPDHIQKLSYKLCHLYYNWAGTIRVPAPCQYAHKLAFLVGQYLGKAPPSTMASRLYYL